MRSLLKRTVITFALFIALSFIWPSTMPGLNVEAQAATIKLNKAKIEISIGETYQLKVTGTKSKVKWSTNNKKYTSVSEDGLVTGIKSGTSFITAEVGNKKYSCRVMVKYPTLNKKFIKVGIGDTIEVKINDFPLNFSESDIRYKVSDKSVVNVDAHGLMTAISEGYTNIYITFGSYKLPCLVEVSFTDKNKEDVISSLKIEYAELNNQIVCIVENSSYTDLTFGYDLAFYDTSNNLVSVSGNTGSMMGFFKGDTEVIYFDKPQKEYSYYKIRFFDLRALYYYVNMKDKVDVTVSDLYDYTYRYFDGTNIPILEVADTLKLLDLNIINHSGTRVILNAYIIYYKDERIVNIERFISANGDIDIGTNVIKNPITTNFHPMNKIVLPEYDDCRLIYTAKMMKR